ncbi:acyl carrier protein [Janthinobacterium lividum]|jgi:acyl carrier protein|uniref:Acyl carrier protein n=1 Tax=Janthinobacterium lividum TaxID=29581 RepID=A0A5C4NQT2_9BURK|nr:acyl carrier protein [Janthinobacterium lividum]TNC76422.1 acyl carrier protein [Janthinobacterium lividum]
MNLFEQCLVDLLADLTNAERGAISLTTTLDQQGVDSFVALRLARAIHDRTGIELELETLFDYPSVCQLAQHLQARAAQTAGAV